MSKLKSVSERAEAELRSSLGEAELKLAEEIAGKRPSEKVLKLVGMLTGKRRIAKALKLSIPQLNTYQYILEKDGEDAANAWAKEQSSELVEV